MQRRDEPEQDARHSRHAGGKQEDAGIECDVGQPRQAVRRQCDDHVPRPDRQDQPGEPAGTREQETLDEEKPRQLHTTGTKGPPNAELASPARRSRQEQPRDVGAGDEQHRADGGENHEERRPRLPHHVVVQADDARSPAGARGVDSRIFSAPFRAQGLDSLLRLWQGDPRLQASDCAGNLVTAPGAIERGEGRRAITGRGPHVDARAERATGMLEFRRHHADDLEPVAVDAQLASDRVGTTAEPALPHAVAQHDNLGNPRRIILRHPKHPAELRLRAEEREVRRADEQELDTLRLVDLGEVRVDRIDAGNLLEEIGAIAIVVELRRRDSDVPAPEADDVGGDAHETVGAGKRQGLEDDGVHDRKHGRVGADAEREGCDSDGGEAAVLAQRAQRESQIVEHGEAMIKNRSNAEC